MSRRVFEPLPPRELDARYTDLRRLGSGGAGVVYRATRRSDGRVVAVKRMDIGTPERRRLAENDLHMARYLHCQREPASEYCALVPVYDAWTDADGRALNVEMKYIEGGDGFDVATRAPNLQLPYDTAAFYALAQRWLESLAATLDAMHEQCVLHRDIKPENLLYERATQRLYLADYGLACVRPEECRATPTVGTREYIDPLAVAPRDRRAQPPVTELNAKSDTYSLGVAMYTMLTGQQLVPEEALQTGFPSLDEYRVYHRAASQQLHRLEDAPAAARARVLFEVVRRMCTPDDAGWRPSLRAVVQALAQGSLRPLEAEVYTPTDEHDNCLARGAEPAPDAEHDSEYDSEMQSDAEEEPPEEREDAQRDRLFVVSRSDTQMTPIRGGAVGGFNSRSSAGSRRRTGPRFVDQDRLVDV